MALMDIERRDGIQLGGPMDYCYECAKKEGKNNYGELEYKECFAVTQNGNRKCYCMDCFKKMLGKYMLIDPAAALDEMEVAEPPEEFKETPKEEKKENKKEEPATKSTKKATKKE